MTFYSDQVGTSSQHCIGVEEDGLSFCGENKTTEDLAQSYSSIWEVVLESDIYEECTCPKELAKHLGFDSYEELRVTARRLF